MNASARQTLRRDFCVNILRRPAAVKRGSVSCSLHLVAGYNLPYKRAGHASLARRLHWPSRGTSDNMPIQLVIENMTLISPGRSTLFTTSSALVAAWFALLLTVAAPAQADFDNGTAAIDRGDYTAARREFAAAANAGNGDAPFTLGTLFALGIGTTVDEKQAFHWYKKSAENGNADGQYLISAGLHDGQFGDTYKFKIDLNSATQWAIRAAAQGHPAARIAATARHKVPARPEWLTTCAEIGHVKCQTMMWLQSETGADKDPQNGLFWLRRAAESGGEFAQHSLGRRYLTSEGLELDRKQGMFWILTGLERSPNQSSKAIDVIRTIVDFRDATLIQLAEEGDPLFQYGAFHALMERRTPSDQDRGRAFLRKAANQDLGMAQYSLALQYWLVPERRDLVLAKQWLTKAAKNGSPEAAEALGKVYTFGGADDILEKDSDLALAWNLIAAERGSSSGISQLQDLLKSPAALGTRVAGGDTLYLYLIGFAFETGMFRSMPQNRSQAVYWYTRAAKRGDARAIKRLAGLQQKFAYVPAVESSPK